MRIGCDVASYVIPTDAPEADGTLEWDKTTLVVVQLRAGDQTGVGYTYADRATATLIHELLVPIVSAADPMNVRATWDAMVRAIRNLGRAGVAAMAISAVDAAAWDLKARLLDLPLVTLLGAARPSVAIYGSGGFTSYASDRLQSQLAGWVDDGLEAVKMKIGRDMSKDRERVRLARKAIGDTRLFVDANGGYTRKEALAQAEAFQEYDVTWFEEPVSSDDLEGLRLLRDRAGMAIAAGEYGYDTFYFRRMLDVVDVLQADASRCLGITGFMQVAALCDSFGLPLSGHCAPSLHAHVACASPSVVHLEYFHDHVRIENMLFEGVLRPQEGRLVPDLSRPGTGLVFKASDAARFA